MSSYELGMKIHNEIHKDMQTVINKNGLEIGVFYKEEHAIEFVEAQAENEVLKKKLERCVQSLKVLANVGEAMKLRYERTWYEDLAGGALKELDAIERGE